MLRERNGGPKIDDLGKRQSRTDIVECAHLCRMVENRVCSISLQRGAQPHGHQRCGRVEDVRHRTVQRNSGSDSEIIASNPVSNTRLGRGKSQRGLECLLIPEAFATAALGTT